MDSIWCFCHKTPNYQDGPNFATTSDIYEGWPVRSSCRPGSATQTYRAQTPRSPPVVEGWRIGPGQDLEIKKPNIIVFATFIGSYFKNYVFSTAKCWPGLWYILVHSLPVRTPCRPSPRSRCPPEWSIISHTYWDPKGQNITKISIRWIFCELILDIHGHD